jgi:hypothetical protein
MIASTAADWTAVSHHIHSAMCPRDGRKALYADRYTGTRTAYMDRLLVAALQEVGWFLGSTWQIS